MQTLNHLESDRTLLFSFFALFFVFTAGMLGFFIDNVIGSEVNQSADNQSIILTFLVWIAMSFMLVLLAGSRLLWTVNRSEDDYREELSGIRYLLVWSLLLFICPFFIFIGLSVQGIEFVQRFKGSQPWPIYSGTLVVLSLFLAKPINNFIKKIKSVKPKKSMLLISKNLKWPKK